ncbi:MAG: hypothetical protein ACK5PG_11550 [Lysobacterales bacterium]
MKMQVCRFFVVLIALWTASRGHAADSALLTERSTWGELARLSEPTKDCPGGRLEQLRQRVGVAGPSSIEELDRQQTDAEEANRKADAATSIVWLYPVSDFIRQNLKAPSELYTFEYSTDPDRSPWWGFRACWWRERGA